MPWQRCQFHLSQNAQRYARRSDQRAAIATDIRDIFNAPSGGEAEAMLRARVEQYYDRNPELADWMETNLPEGFTVFRFARSTWRRIRTNNGLENLNRQIRRRTRVVGIFPNTESALRPHHRCRRGDSRRLADRETVPQPGRFQTTGESDLRSLSVKLQKNSCLADSDAAGEQAAQQEILVHTLKNKNILRTRDAYKGAVGKLEIAKEILGWDVGVTAQAQPSRPIADIFADEIKDFSKYKLAKAFLRWAREHEAADLTENERDQWSRFIDTINRALK